MGHGQQSTTKCHLIDYNFCFLIFLEKEILQLWEDVAKSTGCSIASTAEEAINMIHVFLKKITLMKKKNYIVWADTDKNYSQLNKILAEYNLESKNARTNTTLIQEVFEENETLEAIFYIDSFFPLIDFSALGQLANNHFKYRADYSFVENLPNGLTPKIISKDILSSLEDSSFKSLDNHPDKFVLNNYVERNIQEFHVEIHYVEPDIRILRLDFSSKNLRSMYKSKLFLQKMCSKESEVTNTLPVHQEINKWLNKQPNLIHVFPSYIEIEVISDCEYACTFCPRQFMDVENNSLSEKSFQKIITFLEKQSLKDTSICIGGLGEPLQHPNIQFYLEQLLNVDALSHLIIETNGLYLDRIYSILSHKEAHKIRLIINISSINNYASLHGASNENLSTVLKNIDAVTQQAIPSFKHEKQCFIQVLKIKENQDEIDQLYELAKEKQVNFLLQKYNSYVNFMPEKRVSDMTPLEKFPCWHLRRDMFIRANGDVGFCKQDIHSEAIRGNIEQDDLIDIWHTQKKDWASNFKKDYTKIPKCQSCDEFFTFNL